MQDLNLKTTKAKSWLERSDTELSILINTVMNQKTLSSEMKEDILKIHKFFLDSGKFVEDSKKCVVGVGRLVQVKDVEKVTVSIEKQILTDNFDSYLSFKYLQTQISAKKRDLEFNLSLSDLKKILKSKTCYYTGVEFSRDSIQTMLTLDRVDSKIGYIKGNVVACSSIANKLKNEFLESDCTTSVLDKVAINKMLLSFLNVNIGN